VLVVVFEMEVEIRSDWLINQTEFLKTLHGYEKHGVNYEVGSIDYVTSDEGDERKLLRVIKDPKNYTSKATADTIKTTINFLENEDYDDTLILSEKFTEVAKRLIRKEENLDYISPESPPDSISDIIYAVQMKTRELCKVTCGKVPETEKNCKGFVDGEYNCQVRRISDDADFHTEKKWQQMLMKDFFKLVAHWKELVN
jgi:uncharacterized protein YqgV (UPF0045/DUF77 family)